MTTRHAPRGRGTTLLELVVAMGLVAALLAVAAPAMAGWLDRLAVRGATEDLATLFAAARVEAVARGGATVRVDTASGTAALLVGDERVSARALREARGVQVSTTRTEMSYDARGLGRGAANLRIVVRRRAAADTLLVSRLGRVRW